MGTLKKTLILGATACAVGVGVVYVKKRLDEIMLDDDGVTPQHSFSYSGYVRWKEEVLNALVASYIGESAPTERIQAAAEALLDIHPHKLRKMFIQGAAPRTVVKSFSDSSWMTTVETGGTD